MNETLLDLLTLADLLTEFDVTDPLLMTLCVAEGPPS